MHEHDHSYRHLFARPQLIEELVWRLRRRDGKQVFIYLLVEFQSRSERFMAVRVMSYVAALYQDLIDRGELAPGDRLPLVIPLVVYNGKRRWRAPLELSELIEPVEPAAAVYVPRLLYRVIDQGAYAPEDLEKREGLTALLFWLKSQGAKGPRRVHTRLRKLLAKAGDPDLYRAVLVWLCVEAGQDPARIPEILNLEEFSDMWAKTFEKFEREVREEERKAGERRGEKEGEAKALLRLLERKFGPVDARTRAPDS